MGAIGEEAEGRKFMAQSILIRNMKGDGVFETENLNFSRVEWCCGLNCVLQKGMLKS